MRRACVKLVAAKQTPTLDSMRFVRIGEEMGTHPQFVQGWDGCLATPATSPNQIII